MALQHAVRALPFKPQALGFVVQRGYASLEDKFTVEVLPFKSHKIDPPENKVETSLKELLDMYEMMYKMRRMEIAADMAYKAKLIRGFCHLYDGQEAVQVGIEFAGDHKDSVITSYRDHATLVGRGGSVYQVMAELMGKREGAAHGLGGSMHMYKRDTNFFGGNGIVGAQIPLGAGLALTHKYLKDGAVSWTLYGDGAANQGQKYEALNIAGLWSLPAIFICENNHYGMGTAEWRAAKSPSFYTRGDYIPGLKVDGMDVLAVKQACKFAKAHALANGPIILEMDTYRYHGHSMSDPGSTYRTREEINTTRQERDPVERVKKLLIKMGGPEDQIKATEKAVKKEVDEAVEKAKACPIPPVEWRKRNVYVDTKGVPLRDVDGTYFVPEYNPAYS